MHIATLSFDDGFRKSNIKIAEVYERFGLRACFNVLAAPNELIADEGEKWGRDRGDWSLWNDLQARGHEIMPHGYQHANKAELPFADAKGLIERCLAIFGEKLDGFDPKQAVFNFPFNRSTPELEAWLPTVVRAFRTSGGGLNPLPRPGMTKLTTTGWGPDDCGRHIDHEVARLLSAPEGWLVYNTHGVDGEGWGPITSDYLQRLLARLVEIEGMEVIPAGVALARAWGKL